MNDIFSSRFIPTNRYRRRDRNAGRVAATIIAGLLLITIPVNLPAKDEPALIEVELAGDGDYWVGQKITFYIELYSEGLFAGSPGFDLPQVPGVLLMKLPGRPVMSSKKSGDKTYNVQRHEFAAFAQRSGDMEIQPFEVRFSSKQTPTSDETRHKFTTPKLSFRAKMPPGAEKQATIISADKLNLKENWSPKPGDTAKTGDAFTRTVTFTAADIPGMAFPPWPHVEIPGLGVYPKAPTVRDKSQRGDFTGERIEQITYVCEAPGEVTIPAVAFHWWDLKNLKLNKIELPEISFTVESAPSAQTEAAGATETQVTDSRSHWLVWLLVLIAAGMICIIILLKDKWIPKVSAWRKRREGSEKTYFKKFHQACQSGDALSVRRALTVWLDQINPSGATRLLLDGISQADDPKLIEQVKILDSIVYGQNGSERDKKPISFMKLYDNVKKARSKLLNGAASPTAARDRLPPINPS